MPFILKLRGVDEFIDRCDRLDQVLKRQVIRETCRAAAKDILPAVVAATVMFKYRWPLPKGRRIGDLKRGLKVRAIRRTRKTIGVTVLSTLKKGSKATSQYQTDLYYGAFVNWGHKLGRRPRKGQPDNRKKIDPVPYMDEGFRRSRVKAEWTARRTFKTAVEKYWKQQWTGVKVA